MSEPQSKRLSPRAMAVLSIIAAVIGLAVLGGLVEEATPGGDPSHSSAGKQPDDEMLLMAVAGFGLPYDEDRAVYVPAKRFNGEAELCRGQRVYCVLVPTAGSEVDLDGIISNWQSGLRCPIGDGDYLMGIVYKNPATNGWESSEGADCDG